MSLSHVILGWLSYERMTGYDLNGAIEISTQHFWSTSQSQIYRTLKKLKAEGWVGIAGIVFFTFGAPFLVKAAEKQEE